MPPKPRKRIPRLVSFSRETDEKLKERAHHLDVPVTEVVRRAVDGYFRRARSAAR